FELATPLTGAPKLTFVLEQNHGGGHLIGRARLSVSAAANPAVLARLPEALERILEVPADQRTDAQTAELARHVLPDQVGAALAALPTPQLVYAAAPDFTPAGNFKPARGCRSVSVLRRGDITQPLAPAMPAALSLVPGLEPRFRLADPSDEGQRRAALAN